MSSSSSSSLIPECTRMIAIPSKSYGEVVIKDGVYSIGSSNQKPSFGFASYPKGPAPISPSVYSKSDELKTFIVDLHYKDSQYVYNNGKGHFVGSPTNYSKNYKRISSSKNPVSSVKSFISQYSSSCEAHKLRKRIIAIERIRNSISEEKFRFPLYP